MIDFSWFEFDFAKFFKNFHLFHHIDKKTLRFGHFHLVIGLNG